jgi:hypothetical protein
VQWHRGTIYNHRQLRLGGRSSRVPRSVRRRQSVRSPSARRTVGQTTTMSDPSGWKRRRMTAADAVRRPSMTAPSTRASGRGSSGEQTGNVHCWRCGQHIAPGSTFHTGHSNDRGVVLGAECVSCNLSTAASEGVKTANRNRKLRRQGLLPPVPPLPLPAGVCRIHGGVRWHALEGLVRRDASSSEHGCGSRASALVRVLLRLVPADDLPRIGVR